MIHRRKSAFEKWFSFTRHRRRFGADAHTQQLDAQDYSQLRERIIVQDGEEAKYAHGASVNLDEHLAKVRREFIGQSELLYQHAMLIVLIRREADERAQQIEASEGRKIGRRELREIREAVAMCCLAPIAVFSTLFTDKVLGNAKLAGFTLSITAIISLLLMTGAHFLFVALA